MACRPVWPHMSGAGTRLAHTAGRPGWPKIMQRLAASSCTQGTPAGLLTRLTTGMPGIELEMEGAIQQAPQPARQFMGVCYKVDSYRRPQDKRERQMNSLDCRLNPRTRLK